MLLPHVVPYKVKMHVISVHLRPFLCPGLHRPPSQRALADAFKVNAVSFLHTVCPSTQTDILSWNYNKMYKYVLYKNVNIQDLKQRLQDYLDE